MRALLVAAGVEILLTVTVGCVLGSEHEPGCQVDADCGDGWFCRAGACFQTTTGRSLPVVDGGDAASD
jgi:hypothetical protein